MMMIYFSYYCVFTVIRDEATLGKSMGAATLHSSMSSFFFLACWMWINE